tara:strand:- start:58 stop:165 length:108 start_codon:yes stop_codon:yes gene_type:complete
MPHDANLKLNGNMEFENVVASARNTIDPALIEFFK